MRAIVCHAPGDYHDLRVEEVERPVMREGGVRITVHYASISFSMALMIRGTYQRKFPMPFIPGAEVTGVVTEVAPGVTSVKPGDRVLAIGDWGGYADEVVIPCHTVYPLPAEIDLRAATHLGMSYGTSYGGLFFRGGLRAGEHLLVLGAAGGVGLAAVELGVIAGANVIAAVGSAAKCDVARAHGAHHVIDLSHDDLRECVMRATGGYGLDVIYDPIGGDVAEAALRLLAMDGRIIVIGFASGKVPQFASNILLVKNLSVVGFNWGAYMGWSPIDDRARLEPKVRPMYEEMFRWAVDGRLRPTVSAEFPLERFPEAMDYLVARKSTGKVVLRVGG